jgi:uncharacterized membrane protein
MKHKLILYFATLLLMSALDMLWLLGIAHNFYNDRIGHMLEGRFVPAVLFYIVYNIGLMVFVPRSRETTWQTTLKYGAMFGFFAYATYDLTNLATLKGWPVDVTLVDMLWGTFVTGVAATGGKVLAEKLS